MQSKTIFSRSTKKAFTLIELLVVIAIIAILAAILFPVFGRARENARRSSCQSNLKQLGVAVMQYYQDYDEQGPFAQNYRGASPTGWSRGVAPYLGQKVGNGGPSVGNRADMTSGSAGVFLCPSDPTREWGFSGAAAGNSYAISYFNDDWSRNDLHFANKCGSQSIACAPGGDYRIALPLARFEAPTTTFMITENYGAFNQLGNPNQEVVLTPVQVQGWMPGQNTFQDSTSSPVRFGDPMHLGGWNYLFIDGHVKWMRPERTIGAASGGSYFFPRGNWTIHANDDA